MAELQGLCHWPGVQQVVEASLSFAHGISPSVATLYMPPQAAEIAPGGTLRFTFGDTTIEFPNCRVDEATLTHGGGGWQWMVSIFDRRWKWRFGSISGNYNLVTEDGEIKAGTEKSPFELAKLCLEAAGEENYDIGSLPGTVQPQIQWQNEVPMEALANLCDQLGRRVVLGLDNKVYVHPVGYGQQLPGGYVMEEIGAIDPGEAPDAIVIVCGPTRFQRDIPLEAVGISTGIHRELQLIDDLPYKPTEGWGWPPDHVGVTENEHRKLAQASVFRFYRVNFPFSVPEAGIVVGNRHEIALENNQVATTLQYDGADLNDAIVVSRPAEVRGVFWDDNLVFDGNTPTDTPVGRDWLGNETTMGFSLDLKRCLAVMTEPVFKNSSSAKLVIAEAELKLRTAFSVRNTDTLELLRYEHTLETGESNNTKPRYIRHDEIVLNYIDGVAQNKAEVDAACIKFENAALAEYQTGLPYTRKYAGLRYIQLDGAIQNVTWSVGPSGATTVASRNTEQLEHVAPYRDRRRQQWIRRAVAQTRGYIEGIKGLVSWWKGKK